MSRPVTKLENIEKAAMELFSKKGLAAVTIKDIAQKAGCAEGALYRHYSSKENMAYELHKRELTKFGIKLRNVFKSNGSYAERLHKGVEVFYRFFDEDETTFSYVLLSQHSFPGSEPVEPEYNPIDLVRNFVEEGAGAGEFKIENSSLGAYMIIGLFMQPLSMHIYGRLEGLMVNRVDEVSRCCLKVLGVNKEM
jgi:AcrR family transcriptional regulator